MDLKAERLKRGLSQVEFANEIGINVQTITGIEQGRHKLANVQMHTARKIAKYLEVEVEEILKGRTK